MRFARSTGRPGQALPTALGVAAVAAFVVLAAWKLRVPGLYYDESFQLTTALAFVKGGLHGQVAWVPKSELHLFGHPLPLMAHSYIGAVKTIAFVPVAALFGFSVISVRAFTIAVAALSLVVTFLFARRLLRSTWAAAIGVALLALDPSFVFYSRIDFGPSVFMFLLKAIALWQLLDWWRTGRRRSLVLGALALGLGTYDKTNFLWIVVALPLAAAAIDWRGVRSRIDRPMILTGAAAFVAGCLPLIVYNLSWPPRTLQPALKGTLHVSGGNTSGGPIEELHARLEQLVRLLDGRDVAGLFGSGHGVFPLVPLLVLAAAIWVVVRYARPASRAAMRAPMFLLLCGVVILVASALTPGGSYPHHVLLVYPFPQLVLAAAACDAVSLVRRRPGRIAATAGAAAAVAAALALDVAATTHTLSVLGRTGGTGTFSDGIYRLERYLGREPSRPTIVLDWGIYQNVMGLSQGRLHAEELWQPLNGSRARGTVLAQLTQPDVRYVLHAANATQFQRPRARFFGAATGAGLRPQLDRALGDRRGRPLFEVYRLVR